MKIVLRNFLLFAILPFTYAQTSLAVGKRLTAKQMNAAQNLIVAFAKISKDFDGRGEIRGRASSCEYISGKLECAFNYQTPNGPFGIRAAYVETGQRMNLLAFSFEGNEAELVGDMQAVSRPDVRADLMSPDESEAISQKVLQALQTVSGNIDVEEILESESRCVYREARGWCFLNYETARERYEVRFNFIMNTAMEPLLAEALLVERWRITP